MFAGWRLPYFSTFWLAAAVVHAGEYRILPERSIFAIVTHKGGIAGGKAHNHVIAASSYTAHFELDESDPLSCRFQMTFAAEDLVVDDPGERLRWYPRLEALEILDEPFKELSEKDRAKIRETMLSKKQLDADKFPRISARIEKVLAESSTLGAVELPFRVLLRLEVHGQEVVASVAARVERTDETVLIEAVGTFRFKDFGIKPYSAFLGAVKNKNEFHVYVAMAAVPVEE